MATAIPVMFRGELFPSKKALKNYLGDHVREMPTRTPLEGFDLELAFGVLDLHYNGIEKAGCGVEMIELRLNAFREREFWLRRVDGSEIDFTWAKSMDGPLSDRTHVLGALREVIRPQIKEFRRRFFESNRTPVCALTGAPLRDDKHTHIDHHDPLFVEIADGFVEKRGGLEAIKWGEPRDTSSLANMTDQLQIAAWKSFHREHAVLRAVTKAANLTRPRKKASDAA